MRKKEFLQENVTFYKNVEILKREIILFRFNKKLNLLIDFYYMQHTDIWKANII
jgi:hypothetical protein